MSIYCKYSFCFLSKDEEARIKKEELDLKLAETAFDNFLQENDRLSMEAQKKYFRNLYYSAIQLF